MDCRLIDVSDEKHPETFVIVDSRDYEFLNQWDWYVSDRGYIVRSITYNGKTYIRYMHRIVLDLPDELWGDHINGNTLDNRRANLRAATPRQNSHNRSRNEKRAHGVEYKGVYKNANASTFTARITVMVEGKRKHIYLGSFVDQISAAKAYDEAAVRYFGDRAKVNFPQA